MKAIPRDWIVLAVLVGTVMTATQWWQGRTADRLGRSLAAAAAPGDIRMIASQTCAPCATARLWLTEQRVAFNECVIERDAACRAEYEASGAPGTPLLKVRGRPQLGFSPQRVLDALQTRD